MSIERTINTTVEHFRRLAADQVRIMTDDQLALHADALCEMLAACKAEFDKRSLNQAEPAGTA